MKIRITSRNLKYSPRPHVIKIALAFVSLIFLIFFAYNLYINRIDIDNLFRMSAVLLVIFSMRFLRRLVIHFSICFIEVLNNDSKKGIFFVSHKLWLLSNPLLYFMASNVEFDIKLRRILLSTKPGKLLYRFLLFIFYYPFTRLLYFYRRFIDRVFSDHENELISSRIEGYVIVGLILFPFILPANFKIAYLFYLYIFVLVFLFPLLNVLGHLTAKLVLIVSAYLKNKQAEQNTELKLIKMAMDQSISSFISLSGSDASYPTVIWLVIQRSNSRFSLFGTIINLYFNKDGQADYNMRRSFYFARAALSCGTDNVRAIIWGLYYRKLIINLSFGKVENTMFISYNWYYALYDVLSANGWEAGMFEFFINLAKKSNIPLNTKELQRIDNIISNHLFVMEHAFKLIGDIEKDWGIDPLSINPEGQSSLRAKGYDYPVYEDCLFLFADNYTLEAIKIPLELYKHKLYSHGLKQFDSSLETKIIQFLINHHAAINNRLQLTASGGMFHEYGKHLMANFPYRKENFYDLLVIRAFETTPYEKMQFRDSKVPSALDYLYHEGFYFHPQGIREYVLKRLGENLARWRKEWEDQQSLDSSKPKF